VLEVDDVDHVLSASRIEAIMHSRLRQTVDARRDLIITQRSR